MSSIPSQNTSGETLGINAQDLEVPKLEEGGKELNQSHDDDPYQVTLDPSEDPKNLSLIRKWAAVVVISSAALFFACTSSMAVFAEAGIMTDFGVQSEVTILGLSLYILCLGIGSVLAGPLSELYGRTIIYSTSSGLFFAFCFPVAFAPNISVYLVFRSITGLCAGPLFSVAGGSISDMFTNSQIGAPITIYSAAPFIGPVLGPVLSGFINQNVNWRWTFRVVIIWSFAEFAGLCLLVPETFVPWILKRKAQRLRKSTGDERYWAPSERSTGSLGSIMWDSAAKSFQIIYYEKMALLLDLWTSFILGTMYLTFEAFPIIFGQIHGFNVQLTGLSFVGLGIGTLLGPLTQPLWNRYNKRMMVKYNGNPPPEARLVMGQWGAVLIPISLFWLAFTTYKDVHWVVPIIASIPFGTGVCYSFSSTFTYLVVAYRSVSASAMAGNAFLRSVFAFAFPLFAGYMYNRLGTVGATALLAGLATIMAPLPFVFYRIGGRLRQTSRFAA